MTSENPRPVFFNQDDGRDLASSPEISPHAPKVLLLGGATEGVSTLSGLSDAMRQEGLNVYSFDYTRERAEKDGSPDQLRFQEAKVAQAVGKIDEVAGDGGDKITLFAHSLGGPVAINAALRRPDKIERVVLSNSEGLVPNEELPFTRLAGRFLLETVFRKNLTINRHGRRQTINGTKEIAAHPVSFVGDALNGANSNILPQIEFLRSLGVKVDVILSNADMVYPKKPLLEAVESEALYTENRGATSAEGGEVIQELPFDSISSYYATKIGLMGSARAHKLASKYAGHDQSVIYPQYAAKVVADLVKQP